MQQAQVTKGHQKVFVALGGNAPSDAGEPLATIHAALAEIEKKWGKVTLGKLYATPAFPVGFGPDFVNSACVFETESSPQEVLDGLHDIEAKFGRTRDLRWGQRTLDLDLIAVGSTVLPDVATYGYWRDLPLDAQKIRAPRQLILPHPRLEDRPFVLVPLADIAADWVHPVLRKTVADMLAAHSDAARAEIRPL